MGGSKFFNSIGAKAKLDSDLYILLGTVQFEWLARRIETKARLPFCPKRG
jgi:hypothetical protein